MGIVSYFGYSFLRRWSGLKPSILPPKENISDIIDSFESVDEDVSSAQNNTDFPLTLPDGFTIDIYARDLGKARVLQQDINGTILVSSMDRGQIVAFPDEDSDGKVDRQVVVLSNLNNPHGFVFGICKTQPVEVNAQTDCPLYVAETTKLVRYDYNPNTYEVSNSKKLVDLPSGGRHFTRTLLFNPQDSNELLISVGSSCDVCEEKNSLYATIQSYNLETNELKPFATGLRNSVFMAVNPKINEVWATEMGRDNLGDNLPPDEINVIKKDNDYGWPYCYGENQLDPFGKDIPGSVCLGKNPSHINLQAHSAPLGLAFIPENSAFLEEYWNNLLVSYHGSWNRSEPTGYKIVRFVLDEDGSAGSPQDFISGWLEAGDTALGRPVDILVTENAAIYISDDKAGVIYKVTFGDI